MISDFTVGSPREVLRKSFELHLIDEGDDWLSMLRLRNTLSHDYDGIVIAQACEQIVQNFSISFNKFRETAEKIIRSEDNTLPAEPPFSDQ